MAIKEDQIRYLPLYKSTFYSLKIGPKNRPQLIHGSKTEIKITEIKISSGQISIPEIKFYDKR